MSQIAQYIETCFPQLLSQYAKKAKKNRCPHHGVPFERAVWVAPEAALHRRAEYRDERFWLSWYTYTIVDQFLYTEFPEHYARWIAARGGCPIPMRSAGEGCLKVYRATLFPQNISRMMGVEFEPRTVNEFYRYFTEKIVPTIEQDAGIGSYEFLSRCPVRELFDYHQMFHRPELESQGACIL